MVSPPALKVEFLNKDPPQSWNKGILRSFHPPPPNSSSFSKDIRRSVNEGMNGANVCLPCGRGPRASVTPGTPMPHPLLSSRLQYRCAHTLTH